MAALEGRIAASPSGTVAGIAGKLAIAMSLATVALGAEMAGSGWEFVASAARDLAALAAGAAT